MALFKLHWKARAFANKDFKEIFWAEIISITGGVLAGFFLALSLDKILLIPGMFILLPGFLEMRGNVSGSLAARLGTALDIGAIKPKLCQKYVIENYLATFLEAILVALILAVFAFCITWFVFGQILLNLFIIAFLAAVLSNFIESSLTVLITFWLYKKGIDPNNVMGPYVTTTGDIVSVVCLLFAIAICW
ncbi:MAG: magnesium transporter [Candidatus Nanoarchaeia archaeon]